MRPSAIYASTASRRQRTWVRRKRRVRLLAQTWPGLLLAWVPAPVLVLLLADRWLG